MNFTVEELDKFQTLEELEKEIFSEDEIKRIRIMKIEVTHEILTNNYLRTFSNEDFIVDYPYVYVFAEDSPCVLTLRIDNDILRDAANDVQIGRIISK